MISTLLLLQTIILSAFETIKINKRIILGLISISSIYLILKFETNTDLFESFNFGNQNLLTTTLIFLLSVLGLTTNNEKKLYWLVPVAITSMPIAVSIKSITLFAILVFEKYQSKSKLYIFLIISILNFFTELKIITLDMIYINSILIVLAYSIELRKIKKQSSHQTWEVLVRVITYTLLLIALEPPLMVLIGFVLMNMALIIYNRNKNTYINSMLQITIMLSISLINPEIFMLGMTLVICKIFDLLFDKVITIGWIQQKSLSVIKNLSLTLKLLGLIFIAKVYTDSYAMIGFVSVIFLLIYIEMLKEVKENTTYSEVISVILIPVALVVTRGAIWNF